MNDLRSEEPKLQQKTRGRKIVAWIGRSLIVVVLLFLIGTVYETISEQADKQRFPPPGQLVDIGGYRLHIHCRGTGTPAVIIDAGWGDWSAVWSSQVQPKAAKVTRVCVYDRAGMGYSDPGPLPRTPAHFANELHTLLEKAGIPSPYILAGHSLGGITVRLFAHQYPADVAGVVLLESMSPRQAKEPDSGEPKDSQAHAAPYLTFPARIGLVRLMAGPLGFKPALAPDVKDAYTAFSVTPQYFQTYLDEGTGIPAGLRDAAAVKTFGDLPLIVLTRGIDLDRDKEWTNFQAELLNLSSNSEQLKAEKSGHNVEFDQPEAASSALIKMVTKIRQPTADPKK